MKMWVWSLVSLSGSRIQRCHKLWLRSQMWLGSGCCYGCGIGRQLQLGTSICCSCGHKKKKIFFNWSIIYLYSCINVCCTTKWFSYKYIYIYIWLFAISRATPTACGSSQARGGIGAVAAGLRQSHSNAGSKHCLKSTQQLTVTSDL